MTELPASRQTETQSIETGAAVADVIAVLADPTRLPEWAPAFADSVTHDAGSAWTATKDGRDFALRVVTNPAAGTVDYLREVAPGRVGGAYVRATPRPRGGTVISMTLPLPPNTDPAATAATLTQELTTLTTLLTQQ
jgi:hypothetical protein